MTTILRVSLLFKNPKPVEIFYLSKVIRIGSSLKQEEILIQTPHTLLYTNDKLKNIQALDNLHDYELCKAFRPFQV